MKKYMVFCGENERPGGGMRDYHDSFDTIEDAKEYIKGVECEWFQIVDHKTLNIVCNTL